MPKIRFFARFREEIGRDTIEVDVDNISLENLLSHLIKHYPKIGEFIKEGLIAVNHEIVKDLKIKVKKDDEIAIFPYFSGG